MTGILILLGILLFFILLSVIRPFWLSPIYIHLFLAFCFALLALLYFCCYPVSFNLFGTENNITSQNIWVTLDYFLYAVNAFLIGGLFVLVFNRASKSTVRRPTFTKTTRSLTVSVSSRLPYLLIILALLIFFLIFVIYSQSVWTLSGLWLRSGYQYATGSNQYLVAILELLQFIFFALAGIQMIAKRNIVLFLLVGLVFLLELSTGSRPLVIHIAIMLFVPTLFGEMGKRQLAIRVLGLLLLALYVVPLRSLSMHGLYIYSGLGSILDGYDNPVLTMVERAPFTIYYYTVLGFFLANFVQFSGIVTRETVVIGLNPLPGGIAGWDAIAPFLRINPNAPFSLYGELFSQGAETVIPFFLVVGVVFAMLESRIRLYWIKKDLVGAIIPTALLILFSVIGYQYNLRYAIRYLYYSIAFVLIYSLVFGKSLGRSFKNEEDFIA